MAIDLIEKVHIQMPFYGQFSNLNIQKDDIFAAKR
jgi:hypothetical protein